MQIKLVVVVVIVTFIERTSSLPSWARISNTLPLERCEFVQYITHVLISYSELHKQNCSSAWPENSCGAAWNPNINSPIYSIAQQQKSMQKYCSILKFVWKEFDTKLRCNFEKFMKNVTLLAWEDFRSFCNVYWESKYFLTVVMIANRRGTLIYQALRMLLAEIWVRSLFSQQAPRKEHFNRIQVSNLGDSVPTIFLKLDHNMYLVNISWFQKFSQTLSAKFFSGLDFL